MKIPGAILSFGGEEAFEAGMFIGEVDIDASTCVAGVDLDEAGFRSGRFLDTPGPDETDMGFAGGGVGFICGRFWCCLGVESGETCSVLSSFVVEVDRADDDVGSRTSGDVHPPIVELPICFICGEEVVVGG